MQPPSLQHTQLQSNFGCQQILQQNLQVVEKVVDSLGGGGHVVVTLARGPEWLPTMGC